MNKYRDSEDLHEAFIALSNGQKVEVRSLPTQAYEEVTEDGGILYWKANAHPVPTRQYRHFRIFPKPPLEMEEGYYQLDHKKDEKRWDDEFSGDGGETWETVRDTPYGEGQKPVAFNRSNIHRRKKLPLMTDYAMTLTNRIDYLQDELANMMSRFLPLDPDEAQRIREGK